MAAAARNRAEQFDWPRYHAAVQSALATLIDRPSDT
jgi:hypothetical protein